MECTCAVRRKSEQRRGHLKEISGCKMMKSWTREDVEGQNAPGLRAISEHKSILQQAATREMALTGETQVVHSGEGLGVHQIALGLRLSMHQGMRQDSWIDVGVQVNMLTWQAARSTVLGLGMTIIERLVMRQGRGKVSLTDEAVTLGQAGTSVAGVILMLVQAQAGEGNEIQ
jgi:hypothetical protein